MTPDRRWYPLGRYMILAKPLDTNPYWTTHHIYLRGTLIGRQLSVPVESDCRWYEAGGIYATRSWSGKRSYTVHRKAGPGRPRKSDAERELAEAIAA